MTTILIKKKDTAGAPAPGDLTNAAGGTEIAVNTATKRIYTKDSGGNVVELGTNPSAIVATSITDSGLTSGRVTYASTGGLLVDSANLTFNGTTLTAGGLAGPLDGTVGATAPTTGAFTTLAASGTATLSGLTASTALALDASKNVVSVTNTGTGNNVLATSPTLVTPALGTPSSGTVTNLTGTASININGTVGATTPTTGAFTTLTTSSTVTLNAGTANGVPYLNGSKVLTTGSALTFDGTNLGIGTSSPSALRLTLEANGNQLRLRNSTTRYRSDLAVNATGVIEWNCFDDTGGVYMPINVAGSIVTFQTGSASVTESMRIDSSGGLQIGRTSVIGTNNRLAIQMSGTSASGYTAAVNAPFAIDAGTNDNFAINMVGGGEAAIYHSNSSGVYDVGISLGNNASRVIAFTTAATERMRIDSSGNVGIGTSSPSTKLHVKGGNDNGIFADNTGQQYSGLGIYNNGARKSSVQWDNTNALLNIVNDSANPITFGTSGIERMRIDSGGNLLVGTTDSSFGLGPGFKFIPTANEAAMCITTNTAVGTAASYHLFNTNATNNGYRFYVVSNGGIYNFSGNNSNLSDERTKTNIELAGSYLNKICNIPIKLFNYKDEAKGEQKTLGVIAQDVEAFAPELVNNEGFGDTPKGEKPLKSIYTTDTMFALMKCIQEQQALIESLTTRLTALESK